MYPIPSQRVYSTTTNAIDLNVVRRVATERLRYRRRNQPAVSIRKILGDVMVVARREVEYRRDNEFSAAADIIDASLLVLGFDSYDTISRGLAIEAYHAGRPAFLKRGGYHNQLGALIVDSINRGATIATALEQISDHAIMTPDRRQAVLDSLAPLNRQAATALAALRAQVESRRAA